MAIDEPQAAAADILSEIISYIKQSRPTTTDDKSTRGFVYAQLRPGEMISPRDFSRPWSPMGGSGAAAALPPGATPPAGSTAPAPSSSDIAKRAMNAAFNISQMFDTMMLVTDDSTLERYSGGGKRLDVQYPAILAAMEAPPLPPEPPEVAARRAEAKKVLYDDKGNYTPGHLRYLENQNGYADAIGEFVINQNKTLADPALADSWPIIGRKFQFKVDQALNKWKTDGAEEIEAALATMKSLGIPLEQAMISNARDLMEAWKVSIAGVPTSTPYTFLLPSDWASIEVDDIGWTTLTRDASNYKSHFEHHGASVVTGQWRGESSSSSGSAGVGVFGFGFSGSHSESSSSHSNEFFNTSSDGVIMNSDATDLHIELQYGLVRIMRPWMVPDLFAMRNWYLRGQKAGVISDGTISGQVRDETNHLLPVIPTHVLIVRNVRITASHWGSVRDSLSTQWSKQQSQGSSSASSTSGSVSIPVWGPFNVSGGFSRSDSRYQGDFKDEGGNDQRDDFGAFFEGETLCINGAQVVAWLGEILPFSPPLDDPALAEG